MNKHKLLAKNYKTLFALVFAMTAATVVNADTVYQGPSGGAGGGTFYDSPAPLPNTVRWINVRHGSLVDSVQTWWSNGAASAHHGGYGGVSDWFNVAPGQNLNYVWGYSGQYTNSIAFCTNTWQCSPRWGGNGGQYFSYQAPVGYEIAGFRGRSGTLLDAVGVIIRKR